MRRTDARLIARLAWALVLVAVNGSGNPLVWAAEGQSQGQPPEEAAATPREAAVPDARDTARALFLRGQIHYSLGEYDQAIARFREAYELSSAPALLFNIAQAHRLKGECSQALEIYRHFIRLDSGSPQTSEAEVQIRALTEICPPGPALPVGNVPTRAAPKISVAEPTPSAPKEHQVSMANTRWSTRAKTATVLLAAGVVVATGTGVLYWWNDSRHDRWSAEDHTLATRPGTNTALAAWIARQNSNDALLRSIWHVDTAVGVLAALSAVCVVGSATLGILPEKRAQLAVSPGGIRLAWWF